MFTCFIISAIVMVLGIVGLCVNVALAAKDKWSIRNVIISQIICSVIYVVSGIVALITGIIALVQYIKA